MVNRSLAALMAVAVLLLAFDGLKSPSPVVGAGDKSSEALRTAKRADRLAARALRRTKRTPTVLRSTDGSYEVEAASFGVYVRTPTGAVTISSNGVDVEGLPVKIDVGSCVGPAPVTLGSSTLYASLGPYELHTHAMRASRHLYAC